MVTRLDDAKVRVVLDTRRVREQVEKSRRDRDRADEAAEKKRQRRPVRPRRRGLGADIASALRILNVFATVGFVGFGVIRSFLGAQGPTGVRGDRGLPGVPFGAFSLSSSSRGPFAGAVAGAAARFVQTPLPPGGVTPNEMFKAIFGPGAEPPGQPTTDAPDVMGRAETQGFVESMVNKLINSRISSFLDTDTFKKLIEPAIAGTIQGLIEKGGHIAAIQSAITDTARLAGATALIGDRPLDARFLAEFFDVTRVYRKNQEDLQRYGAVEGAKAIIENIRRASASAMPR